MNKKYTYEFVNETVEIEIEEKWAIILEEEDSKEYNVNHRETRRHEGLDTGMEGGDWLLDHSNNTQDGFASKNAKDLIMSKASKILTPKQLEAFEKVCISGYTEAECGKLMCISQPTVHEHLETALIKLRKYI